jgi:hypothetical protein
MKRYKGGFRSEPRARIRANTTAHPMERSQAELQISDSERNSGADGTFPNVRPRQARASPWKRRPSRLADLDSNQQSAFRPWGTVPQRLKPVENQPDVVALEAPRFHGGPSQRQRARAPAPHFVGEVKDSGRGPLRLPFRLRSGQATGGCPHIWGETQGPSTPLAPSAALGISAAGSRCAHARKPPQARDDRTCGPQGADADAGRHVDCGDGSRERLRSNDRQSQEFPDYGVAVLSHAERLKVSPQGTQGSTGERAKKVAPGLPAPAEGWET